MSYSYEPRYKLLIANVDASGKRVTALREVRSLQSLTATVPTDTTIGTLTATWADTDFSTFHDTVSRPKPMVLVQLQLADRQGQWGIAWTGLADSISRDVEFGRSKTYTLQASSPYKLFDIGLQSASAALGLAMDYAEGVKGTAVLRYAAQQVGYPGTLALLPAVTGWAYSLDLNAPGTRGTIDYSADVGANTWGAISSTVFISPAQQTYSAILQSLVADTEIELFFNELGQLIWRPLAYLNVTGKEKVIQKDQILRHTFTESDQGVLTTVYVRYSMAQQQFNQGVWNAPSAMAAALRPRAMVFYTPWIVSKAGADALATALGLRYSGNMHTARLTMVADPSVTAGTTIRVPKFPDLMPVDNPLNRAPRGLATQLTPWYYYYVYSVTYDLQVGGQFAMTLDLRYGRDEQLAFPYLNYSPYLQDFIPAPNSMATPVGRITPVGYDGDPAHPGRIGTPLTPSVDPSQDARTILVDPSVVAPGSLVMVTAHDGTVLGEYTTAAGPTGTGVTLPTNPTGATQVFLTVEQVGQTPIEDTGTNAASNQQYTNPGAGNANAGAGGGQTSAADGVVGDHVSQLWNGQGNDDCGPACVVRYLRNRSRRGQAGLPVAGDKHQQIVDIRSSIGHAGNTTFADLTAQVARYGVVALQAANWAQVQAWTGEALVLVYGQPTPASWPSWFLPAGEGHLILWMKDLAPGTLFNDPLTSDQDGVSNQKDVSYDLASIAPIFGGALLLP